MIQADYTKKQSKKFDFCGSSTIETALIMPLILTILFMLIYLTLFLYGKAQISRNAYVSVLRASQAETEPLKKRTAIANQELNQLLSESYLEGIDVTKDMQSKGNSFIMHVNFKQKIPAVVFMEKGMSQKVFTDSVRFEAKTNHPVSFIRSCRKLLDGISTITQDKKGQREKKVDGNTIQTGSQ